jgi:SAM-dependent methyltransferase
MNPEVDWHLRFKQQAQWTAPLRRHLYQKAHLPQSSSLLEVGCGTGAILSDLPPHPQTVVHGLDLDLSRLGQARLNTPSARLVNGDALALPYPSQTFDLTFCHFLLLWVKDPLQALREMQRVTRPKGAVLVMAEPDYSQRLDQPDSLAALGKLQTQAVQQQGADPYIGARLPQLFEQAGLHLVESGCLQQQDPACLSPEDWEQEWTVLESDLADSLPASELAHLKEIDAQARKQGTRTLFIPTHFAWGWA